VSEILAPPPPIAWYGSSFVYYEPDPSTAEELDAAAEQARARRLAAFRPEAFDARPGGGDTAGVVLGRFLPVHDGHRYLIEYARAYTGRVFVFVRVGADDPVPWPVRRDWLAELFPDVTVVPVDAAPNPVAWLEKIRAHVDPDYLFAGEDYGSSLASQLNAEFVPVDRDAIPVSGTKVRADPWAFARYLPPCVRAWYLRRVCLIGPESTGKSRLAQRLARHYETVHVPEFARTWFRLGHLEWEPGVVSHLAEGQRTAQAVLARHASRVLFCDTDLLAVRLWSERLFDAAPDWMRAASEDTGIDLYLLTGPDLPFTGDAQFNRPAERAEFHARCERELTRLGRPFVHLKGSMEGRFRTAVGAVDALLAR
jgi:NadR type nicotinamide-nucleotide adenylyltransferase